MAHLTPITRQRPARAQYEDIDSILLIVQTILGLPQTIAASKSTELYLLQQLQEFQKSPAPPA